MVKNAELLDKPRQVLVNDIIDLKERNRSLIERRRLAEKESAIAAAALRTATGEIDRLKTQDARRAQDIREMTEEGKLTIAQRRLRLSYVAFVSFALGGAVCNMTWLLKDLITK